MNLFVRIVLFCTTKCIIVADRFSLVPILTSERFMRIRPGDVLLAHAWYGMYLLIFKLSLLWFIWTEGFFAALLFVCGFVPLTYLLASLVLRLTLEFLLFLNRE